jgi:hypothetical protein
VSPTSQSPDSVDRASSKFANFSGHQLQASDLHVIGAFSNPHRTKVRPRLVREWLQVVARSGAQITLVEHAFGDRDYEFSKAEMPDVNLVQLRGYQEHWLQYAMYNVGIAHLPPHARYVCVQDTDVEHARPDWAIETLHMLQHHKVGQTWSSSVDLSPNLDIQPNEWGNATDRSFCWAWLAGDIDIGCGPYAPPYSRVMLQPKPRDWRSHTGYSWALRREVINGLGRLPDWLIAGSSDWHLALGFSGRLRTMCMDALANGGAAKYSQGYYDMLLNFATLCDRHVAMDIGCVPGMISHSWHGSKKLRFYGGREAILTEAHFDPQKHLVYDVYGMPTLSTDNHALREGLRRYGALRNEDSIDIY